MPHEVGGVHGRWTQDMLSLGEVSNNVKGKLRIRAESKLQNTAIKEAVAENIVRKETLSYNKSSGEDVPDHSGNIKAVPDDRC